MAWLPLLTATLPFPVRTGATPDMRVFREEVFGPVTPVFNFSSEDGKALQMGACRRRPAAGRWPGCWPGAQQQCLHAAGNCCYMPRCCL